jgi:hypothetical protein
VFVINQPNENVKLSPDKSPPDDLSSRKQAQYYKCTEFENFIGCSSFLTNGYYWAVVVAKGSQSAPLHYVHHTKYSQLKLRYLLN